MMKLLLVLCALFVLPACAVEATGPTQTTASEATPTASTATPPSSALHAFNDSLYDALSPSHLFALLLQLLLLFGLLFLLQRGLARLNVSHPESGRRTRRWLPAIRLGFALVGALLIVKALLPDHPTARAVVVAGVLIAVLWASRDVLRNAAAGAVLIARHAVEVGQYLKVGEYEGLVVAVTLRGIELESPDGTHTFVPGLALHTNPAVHAHDQGRFGNVDPTHAGLEYQSRDRARHRHRSRRSAGAPKCMRREAHTREEHGEPHHVHHLKGKRAGANHGEGEGHPQLLPRPSHPNTLRWRTNTKRCITLFDLLERLRCVPQR